MSKSTSGFGCMSSITLRGIADSKILKISLYPAKVGVEHHLIAKSSQGPFSIFYYISWTPGTLL